MNNPPPTREEILERLSERKDEMTILERLNRVYMCQEIFREMDAEEKKEEV